MISDTHSVCVCLAVNLRNDAQVSQLAELTELSRNFLRRELWLCARCTTKILDADFEKDSSGRLYEVCRECGIRSAHAAAKKLHREVRNE